MGPEVELLGATLDPFAAWLMIRGLRTLGVRMEYHQKSALAVARVPRGLVRETIKTLGAVGDASAVPVLGRYAARFAPDVARALARIHHESSARQLVELVVRRKSEREAGRALASMPAAVVVPVLLDHFESRHIRRVLVRIAGTDLGSSLTPWKRWWKSQP